MTQLNYETPPPEFELNCPACGQVVFGQNALQAMFKCPACGTEFLPPLGQVTDTREDELSALRIQNFSTLRRATYRSRSHFIVGAAATFIADVEMLMLISRSLPRRAWLNTFAALCVGVAMSMLFWHCVKRVMQLTKELRESKLESPTEPQDFSNLGDGSQRVRDLENLTH